jgi:mannose-1-phosphate guanylyltransferase
VEEFVEKPSRELAEKYVDNGKYYWNSGIFLFRASRYLEEPQKFRPDILQACNIAIKESELDLDFCRVGKGAFEACEIVSIDYAIMEISRDALVIPMQAGWSDIDFWYALWDISEKDICGNVVEGDVVTHNSKNSYIRTDQKLVSVVDVEDLVVVCTKDAVLVAK